MLGDTAIRELILYSQNFFFFLKSDAFVKYKI